MSGFATSHLKIRLAANDPFADVQGFGYRAPMKIENLVVTVPERPTLGHVGGSISFLPSCVVISRIERETQVSHRGAHLNLLLSSSLLLECFGRRLSTFNFRGPSLGQLDERSGLDNYEYGGFGQHGVTELRLRTQLEIDIGIFRLELTGQLSPMQQSHEHWEMPSPLTQFGVNVTFPVADAGSVFHGKDAEMQSRVEKRMERFTNM